MANGILAQQEAGDSVISVNTKDLYIYTKKLAQRHLHELVLINR